MGTLTRVQRTTAATPDHTFMVGETGTDSTTQVTVAITDANGAAVTSGNATSAGQGRYTFPLPAQAQLSELTVAWSGTIAGAAVVETDVVEIVGGFLFTLAQGRASDPSLGSTTKYPLARLVEARLQTEVECEEICDRAFVPRYRRVVLDGSGSTELVLPDSEVRTIRAARVAPALGEAFVALTAGELAKLAYRPDGRLVRTDYQPWTAGLSNVVLEYECGRDAPPEDLRRAALRRFRSWCNIEKSVIPDRVISYSNDDGDFRLAKPGPWETGIADVDAVYARYSRRERSGAGPNEPGRAVPASRSLNYDPQRSSLFHGGIR